MQETLGMEFQTVGQKKSILKKIAKKKSVGYSYKDPKHGDSVLTKDWGTMEADGTDLEFVTKSVDVDENGSNIRTLVEGAKKEFEEQIKFTSKRELRTPPREGNVWYTVLGNSNYVINPEGTKSSHPQATIGIARVKIPDLIKGIARLPQQGSPKDAVPHIGLTRGADKKVTGVRKVTVAKQQQALKDSVDDTDLAKKTDASDFSDKQKAFLFVIKEYIDMRAFHKDKDDNFLVNAKSQMPLMLRTSLRELFKELNAIEQNEVVTYLQTKYTFADVEITGELGGSEITLQEWFDGIGYQTKGTSIKRDLLDGTFHSVSEISETNINPAPLSKAEKGALLTNLQPIWVTKIKAVEMIDDDSHISAVNQLIIDFNKTPDDTITKTSSATTIALLIRWIENEESYSRVVSTKEDKFEPFDKDKALLEWRSIERKVPLEDWPELATKVGKFVYQYHQ